MGLCSKLCDRSDILLITVSPKRPQNSSNMPKGKHKGRSRHFTNFEALEDAKKKEEKERQWRKENGIESEESDEDGSDKSSSEESSSEEESSSDEGETVEAKKKGVQGLIEIENPNLARPVMKKVSSLNSEMAGGGRGRGRGRGRGGGRGGGSSEGAGRGGAAGRAAPPKAGEPTGNLSRREREEIEKQKAQAHYRKLHAEGKTEEARSDLARLALIKQQRAEAAAKKEEDKKAKDEEAAAKRDNTAKALNKKR